MHLHTRADYLTNARYDFLSRVENDVIYAYADTKGIATIGVGINLRAHDLLILQTLGRRPGSPDTPFRSQGAVGRWGGHLGRSGEVLAGPTP